MTKYGGGRCHQHWPSTGCCGNVYRPMFCDALLIGGDGRIKGNFLPFFLSATRCGGMV
ncbi:hypothetical protein [Zhongshania sp.]|uniref:hypothetical protein n=1 Tax=Zhongshania sp. TaxID=1971902 RepID=UPI003567B265